MNNLCILDKVFKILLQIQMHFFCLTQHTYVGDSSKVIYVQ